MSKTTAPTRKPGRYFRFSLTEIGLPNIRQLPLTYRNIGSRLSTRSSLIVAGIMTGQCVESAMPDACDLEYLVTLVTDACTTDAQRTIAPRHPRLLPPEI